MRNVIQGPKVKWIDIENPAQEDVEHLKENFNFHPFVLGELTQPGHHRPKVERRDENYLFMSFYYPVYNKEKQETRSIELDIIATKETLITSHEGKISPLKSLFDGCNLYEESKQTYMGEGSGQLLYYVLIALWKNCIAKLDQVDARIDDIEKNIFGGREKEMVREISLVKTDIINFWRIIEPQGGILESLAKEGQTFWGENLESHFHDILGTYAQAWNSLKTHRETILALEDTNQSLLSTRSAEIIRILTVFSVILLPLTLLASIWGMNTYYLPLRGSPLDFWIIFSLMVAVTTSMVIYFRKKGWL